jgi:hypothetical protein
MNRMTNHYWIYVTHNGSKIEFSFGRYGISQDSLTKPLVYKSLEEMIEAILRIQPFYKGVLFYTHGYMADTSYFEEKIGAILQTQVFDKIHSEYDLIISLKWSSHLFYPGAIPLARAKGKLLFQQINKLISELLAKNTHLSLSFMNHSMGNRVFVAMMESYLKGNYPYRIEQVHMFAPDINEDIFSKELRELPPKCRKIFVYYNQDDKTLMMAKRLDKYPRLGLSGPKNHAELPMNIKQIDASKIYDTEGIVPQLTLHRYFYASPTIRSMFINELLIKR